MRSRFGAQLARQCIHGRGHRLRGGMLGRDQQPRLGVEATFADEQGLQRYVFKFGHAARDDHGLGFQEHRFGRVGDSRVFTKRGEGFAKADDRGRRQRNGALRRCRPA